MGRTPLRPSTQDDQNAALPTPLGATTPRPVTTTLRMDHLRQREVPPPRAPLRIAFSGQAAGDRPARRRLTASSVRTRLAHSTPPNALGRTGRRRAVKVGTIG